MTTSRQVLDHDLTKIRENILRLGALVEQMTAQSVQALKDRNVALARKVRADEKESDNIRYEVEEACVQTIAMQQPVASDLRQLIVATHMAVELERMADYANGIAKIVIRTADEPLLKPLIDIPRMQEIVNTMTHKALDAYVRRDLALANAVIADDDAVDELYKQVLRELITFMTEDPRTITRAMNLLFVAHNLERMGDRAVNLCERVIYAVTGEMGEHK
jgi:phosphate transport system protein